MQASFQIKEWNSKEIIMENMKILNEYYEYIKSEDKNNLLSRNHNFELNASITQMIHLLKTVHQKYDLLEKVSTDQEKQTIQKSIDQLYEFFLSIYNQAFEKFNIQKEIEQNMTSDLFVQENFFVTKNSILWINQYLVWINWAYFMYIWWTSKKELRVFNLTSTKWNWNHLNSSWHFCQWNTYTILENLFKTDIPAFLVSLADTLADHDDKAYHMADKWTFIEWNRFFENVIQWKNETYKEYKEDKEFILKSIKQKTNSIKRILSFTEEELYFFNEQTTLLYEWVEWF